MELANIEKLLEKYENAETTLQEEAVLKNYFTRGNVAPHMQEYAYMFTYFTVVKEDTYTKTIKLAPKKTKKMNFKWLSLAASIMLLFSVFLGQQEYKEYQERKKAEKIYAQVNKGLTLLSNNLKKGEQAVDQFYKHGTAIKKVLK
jgi:hypothetical protein